MVQKSEPSIASVFPMELIYFARSQGVDTGALERRIGLFSEVFCQEPPELAYEPMHSLMLDLWHLYPDELLGLRAGLHIPPTSLGCMGIAFLAASDLGEALFNLKKYWRVIGRGLSFRYEVVDNSVEVTFGCSFETDEFLARWMTETGLGVFWRGLTLAVGDTEASQISIRSRYSGPEDPIDEELPVAVIDFDCVESQVVFPEYLLGHRFSMSSERGLRQALGECEREAQYVATEGIFSRRVSSVLDTYLTDFPDLNTVADTLCLQPRTLSRALLTERTSFSKLLSERILKQALNMLRHNSLSIAEISEQLGYSEASSFYRAFRRWTGMTPAQARQTLHKSHSRSAESDSF